MLTTGLLDKITGVLSGQILLSGLLPALLTLGYGLLFATRLGELPLAEILAGTLTLPALLAALYLITVTLLFESFLNPLLMRWLCGDALWFGGHAKQVQAQERQHLEELVYAEGARQREWSAKKTELEAGIGAARHSAGAPASPTPPPDPVRIRAIQAIRDEARRAVPDIRNFELPCMLATRLCDAWAEPGAADRTVQLDDAHQALQRLMESLSRGIDRAYGELQRELVTQFPTRDCVRPTRFGNRMAAIDA